MHILNINPRILKIEPLLEQIPKWRLLPDLYDMIIFFLQGIDPHNGSPSKNLKIHNNSPVFVPTRSVKVRIRPTATIPMHGYTSNHPDTRETLLVCMIGLAIIYFTTISFLISVHRKRLERPRLATVKLGQKKRGMDRTSLRDKRQPPSKLSGFAATIMLFSCLLWALGTLHATSRFLWTLVRNSVYTVMRWALEHPGAVMATTSNILVGFDVFDALFSHIILQEYKIQFSNLKYTLYKAMIGFFWLPVLAVKMLAVFLNHLAAQVVSAVWGFICMKLKLRASDSTKTLEIQTQRSRLSECPAARIGSSWLPIELSGGVPAQLDPNNLVVMRNIAQSGFGRLYRATDISSGRMLAVKCVSKTLLGEGGEPLLLDEIRAHHRMNSDPRFPSLFGCFLDQHDYILVMPYFPKGDLSTLIKDSGGCLSRSLARFYCAELFLAIRSLHKAAIIHGDLKPENILLDEDGHLVITDFGLATVFSKNREREDEYPLWREAKEKGRSHFPPMWPNGNPHTVRRAAGTEIYAAPEVFIQRHFSYGSDYWSMGVIYHEMVTGQLPYDVTWKGEIRHVLTPLTVNLNQQARHVQPLDSLSSRFLTKVLSPIPESRPNVREMKRDQVWGRINWKAIERREIEVPSP